MPRKVFQILMASISISCLFMSQNAARSSYCSDLRDKCHSKCEKIRLNDILQRECYGGCGEAYAQCIKERPQCGMEDECCALRQEVEDLRSKVHYLERKLHSQARDQN